MKTNDEPTTRLTWCPPVGEGFIVSPSLAELEAAMLHRGAEFWDVGSRDGGLYFDVADHPTAELKLMFAAPGSFCVLHTDCLADIELVASDSAPSPETLCVRPGGNPWRLPRHYFVDRITAWRAVQIFSRDGRCSSDVSWIPFEPSDLQEQTSPENSDFTFFQAEHAVVLPDCTIRIPAGGFGSNGMWDGSVSIASDSTEYAFWHWVIGQKGPLAVQPLDDNQIAALEFNTSTRQQQKPTVN